MIVALRAVAEVNVAAIERNVATLIMRVVPPATLCAVVKADGYGHGAVEAAKAALRAGASTLAVATAQEAAELRAGALPAPIIVLGALSDEELPVAIEAEAELVAWDPRFVAQVAQLVKAGDRHDAIPVHVKLDTGMGRLGTRDRAAALELASQIRATPGLRLAGAMTHFATSDDDAAFMEHQRALFAPFAAAIRQLERSAIVHAANSGAVINAPATHFDLVRCGIAIYGCDPMHRDPADYGLEPALTLASYVAAIKRAEPGQSAGYGRRFVAEHPTHLATLPIGYGDGVPRRLTNNADVLIGGRRYPLVGTVSMDNVTVDLGPDPPPVAVGQRATLIGTDGAERQTAEDLARRLGTINYEILCGISRRVPRRYHADGHPQ